jgi:hypothetical protein
MDLDDPNSKPKLEQPRPCRNCQKDAHRICTGCGCPVCDECYMAYSECCVLCAD